MPQAIDITGQKYGKLTAISLAETRRSPGGHTVKMWNCVCDCGNKTVVALSSLRFGSVKSCGCYAEDKRSLIGQKYGRLTVIAKAGVRRTSKTKTASLWLCKCDCGNEKVILGNSLRTGKTVSCGCFQHETQIKNATKHNLCGTRIYNIYNNMIGRCKYANHTKYKDYGARGIKVCDEWANNFDAFYKWAMANGYKNNLTIERIDVNGNYEPGNCTWITNEEQAINRRSTHWVTYKGEKMPLSYLAQKIGVATASIRKREEKFNRDYEAIVNDILNSKNHKSRKEI